MCLDDFAHCRHLVLVAVSQYSVNTLAQKVPIKMLSPATARECHWLWTNHQRSISLLSVLFALRISLTEYLGLWIGLWSQWFFFNVCLSFSTGLVQTRYRRRFCWNIFQTKQLTAFNGCYPFLTYLIEKRRKILELSD